MGNIVEFNPTKLPARIREREGGASELTRSLAGGGTGGAVTKRISIRGGVFRLQAGSKEIGAIEDRHLDVVIVNAAPKVGRKLYLGAYDANAAPSGPDCWSNDGDKPDASIESPQSSNCAECPHNVAGSGAGNSRKCRFEQRIAVTLPDNMDGDVMQMIVPGASLFGKGEGDKLPLRAYAKYLADNGIEINEVVTQMRFDTSAQSPKLFFKPVRFLDDAEYAVASKQGSTDAAKKMVMMTAYQGDTVTIPDAPKLEGKKPAKAAPVVESDDEDDSEPEVRKTSSKAAAPKKSPLSQLAAEWDDE